MGDPARRGLDAGCRGERAERVREIVPVQRPAPAVDEERVCLRLGEGLVAGLLIGAQRGGCGRVQEHQAGLSELGVTDGERPRVQVGVVPPEAACLTLAHAGHGQQANQRSPRCRAQRWREAACRAHERGDLLRGVEIRGDSPLPAREHVLRRDLGGRVERLQVPGEDPHGVEPAGLVDLIGAASPGLCRPLDCQVRGHVAGTAFLAEPDEAHQVPALGRELKPEGAAHRQVLLGPGPQRAHRPAPGHGRVSGRSASWSTLA